ncbi:MAG: hypothetical protein ACQSGP_21810 [Frankia sp.]
MNATELLRGFRAGMPGPGPAGHARARAALDRAIEGERISTAYASGPGPNPMPDSGRLAANPVVANRSAFDGPGRRRAPGRRRVPQRLLPVVAVAATVVLIVLAFVLVPSGPAKGPDTRALTTASTASPARPPVVGARNAAAAGRWFAVLEQGATAPTKTLTVRNATTGAVTTRVTTPAGIEGWFSLSGTQVPGLFFVAGSAYANAAGSNATTIYRLQVDSRGRFSSLTPLFIDGGLRDIVFDLAASPDGRRVAIANVHTSAHGWGPSRIDVADLVTGKSTVFTSPSTGDPTSLSWDATGRYLAFAEGGTGGPVLHDGLWILDTSRSGDLFAVSRRVATGRIAVGTYNAVLSADARHMYLVSLDQIITVTGIDVATGQQRQLLHTVAKKQPASPGWSNFVTRSPAGLDLLVMEAGGVLHRINLATMATTAVPFTGGQPQGVAW